MQTDVKRTTSIVTLGHDDAWRDAPGQLDQLQQSISEIEQRVRQEASADRFVHRLLWEPGYRSAI